jgi:hypothetical protein
MTVPLIRLERPLHLYTPLSQMPLHYSQARMKGQGFERLQEPFDGLRLAMVKVAQDIAIWSCDDQGLSILRKTGCFSLRQIAHSIYRSACSGFPKYSISNPRT